MIKFRVVFLMILFLALIACDSTLVNIQSGDIPVTNTIDNPSATLERTNSAESPTLTTTQKPAQPTDTHTPTVVMSTIIPPTQTDLPECVKLQYGGNAQFVLIGPSGQRIFLDVHDPDQIPKPLNQNDILLTTHTHWDHWNESFQSTFPGRQLFVSSGVLEAPGVHIRGIASAHNDGDLLKENGGSNYIFRIDMGGLRIVHLGDIGQNAFSEGQLAELKNVDIAISQINNPYSDMNAENNKGINLLNQIQPRLMIPTHVNLDTVKSALLLWDVFYSEKSNIQLCRSDFDHQEAKLLLMGDQAEIIKQYLDLTEWQK
jgi:L-ascorbate metabolism protein UlaG (beta-lactamase superfamily)